jgi:hypothetical protein
MTASTLNPFPDYAVTRLTARQDTNVVTIVTPPIAMGRELVKKYVAGVSAPLKAGQTNAALCAVRGDYGTGKTHLLNDVASQIAAACISPASPSILRLTCIETDPLSWFRTKVGQRLDELPLDEKALRLYGYAGIIVASKTKLTEAAADLLQEDPTRIRNLIRDNKLSVDEVGREFENQLAIICKEYDQTVCRVLSRLVSSETEGAARKWISGATLTSRDAELLGVPASIESADMASSVLGAIAAMHKALGHPFVMLVDEFEHFTRYDVAHNSWGNVTWLKRLLEELGNAGALALVAGHWTAWKTTNDYLDRFPQYAPIDLVKLEPIEIIEIVKRLLGALPKGFGEAHAQVIATVTDGNMRRVMSLCNLLFRQTDGFSTQLEEKQIHEAWTCVAQRIPQQQALEQIAALLEPLGFEVNLDTSFHAIPFDLVAEKGSGGTILIQAKHSITPADHYDAARKFIDKLQKVENSAPHTVGMFLSNGSIDDELLGILRNSRIPNLRWFDLTTRDIMERITAEISAFGGDPASAARIIVQPGPDRAGFTPTFADVAMSDGTEAESPMLKALKVELEQKLRELDKRRSQEAQELKARLENQAKETPSPRYDSVRSETEVSPERARASYEAMLEVPPLNKKVRYLGTPLMHGVLGVVFGLTVMIEGDHIAEVMAFNQQSYLMLKLMFLLWGILFPIVSISLVWRRYSRVSDYLEFSRQTIQDLYLRDVPIRYLSSVNTALRWGIDRYGIYRAREAVIEQLQLSSENLPPEISSYFREIAHMDSTTTKRASA